MGSGNRYHIYDADHIQEMNIKETKDLPYVASLEGEEAQQPRG